MSLGIGVIGAGVMGADHVRIVAQETARARVVAVCDQDLTRGRSVAALAHGARAVTDPLALIADKEVQAVVVASPDATHADYALACVAAGKPALCEKPLAPTSAECFKILAAEQAHGRRLIQVGYMRRFDPGYDDMRRRLAAGDLGDALLMHCVHRNAAAPEWFTALMAITNSLVHEIDIARWLLSDEIASIQILRGRTTRASAAADPLQAIMRMAGGQIVDVEVFMNAGYGYDVRAELVCEKGTLTMVPPAHAELRQNGVQSFAFAQDWRPRFAAAYRRQMQAFVDSIETGQATGASAWDGLVATAVAEAGVRAFESGAPVDIELPAMPKLYGG
jgi:myo-inositol 2-dehydrogenase / D-chiro-inositol 1-dehydrogenase